VDAYREVVGAAEDYADALPESVRLELAYGDVARTGYPDASFDLVICNEAISHFGDVDAFVAEAHRVLRPGGMLVIADGNNARNPRIRRYNIDLWETAETGAGHGGQGHVLGEPLEDKRARMIEEGVPELGSEEARAVARATSGMTGAEVVAAAREYAETGAMPTSPYRRGDLPVDPETGQVPERMLDPFELRRRLQRSGFRARAVGHWRGARANPALRAANRVLAALSPLTISTATAFRVVGERLP
jgi:SAM-dependent methyltransferase